MYHSQSYVIKIHGSVKFCLILFLTYVNVFKYRISAINHTIMTEKKGFGFQNLGVNSHFNI